MGHPTRLVALLTLAASSAWAGVAGRVLDGQGAPVAGAAVTAFAPETTEERAHRLYSGRERPPLGSVRSGPDGAFRIEGAAAVLDLQTVAEGYRPAFARALPETPTTLELEPAATRRGVVTADGKPVAGARLVWVGEEAEWSARTGADGSYQVPDPKAWSHRLFVLHPDFAPFEIADDAQAKPAIDPALDTGVVLEGRVADEQGRPIPDATIWVAESMAAWPLGRSGADGTFRVAHAPRAWQSLRARTRALTGSATRQAGRLTVVVQAGRLLSGTVRDAATQKPLAGAAVTIVGWGAGYETALTDAAGVYRVEALDAGQYHVMAARTGYTAEARLAREEGVDLRTAAAARLDLSLRKQPTVSGRVRDEAGRPVEGAVVALGIKGPHIYATDPYGALGGDDDSTRTGIDGSFTLTMPDDDPAVDVLKERPLTVLKRGYAAGRAEIKVGPTGPAPVAVTLTRGIELAGRASSPDGAPLPGVAVTLAEDGTLFGSMIASHFLLSYLKGEGWTTTDAAGRFTVRVHPAVHHLAFRGAGVAPRVVRGYDPRGGEALEVVLEPAATLRGRVVRPDGRAVPDVTITLSKPESMGMQEDAATTGADGRFEVKDLARGQYELTAVHEKLGIHETRTVEVPAADWQLVLEASGTLRGRVVNAATRQPVTVFHLFVAWTEEPGRPAGLRQAEVEDAAGAFELADVPARDLSVRATADGYAPRQIEGVAVPAGAEGAEVEVALDAEAPIHGRVTAEDKASLTQAMVRLVSKGESEDATAMVDERGEYELRGVAPGEVTLTYQAQGFVSEKRTLDTRQTTRLDVTLRRGLSLSGVVVSEGAGVPGAMVSASSSALNAQQAYLRSDEQGRFKLEGLVAGRYSVSASGQGKGSAKLEDVDPETAGTLRLVLERPPQGTLTGKVVGLTAGDELVFAEVKASNEDGETGNATVDGAGAFRMEDAPAGRVTVRATANTPVAMRQSRPVEVTLAPGAQAEVVLEFPSAVVSGQVTRDGRPVPGLAVSFDGTGLASARGRTDVHGHYEVAGLESGRYQVSVSGDGSSFGTEYVVSGSGELDIDITGGSVQGKAVRADGGTPVPGVEIALWPLGAGENRPDGSATTNGQGEFSLRSLREGRYRLTTSKAGFGQEVREVEVARGASASVLLELSPAAGVSVSVVDARDGRPLEATVVVRDLARHIVANRHSGADDDGSLNIALADGSYLLSTSASGYGTATVPVTAPAQGLRVGLTPGGTLVIESARDLHGRARLLQPDGEEYVQCWCNGIAEIELSGRRTTVEHVTAGSYTLEALDGDEVVARQPVVIREGQKTQATID